ncbi:MAG: radical SAM protein [Desulfobacteraceae bacterium]|nr:radical SAM protein [Desulfobacteraceae bacterium]MDH3575919.1 radical SAM protein [Desulfobacteraceae bacterium]MDH3722033.1 radical SAM protein [Desulfobacteraceae bacterium]MDH3837903.1 radical SAM protein [Desulfobacteraceae bacterium]MDH3874242.1 radical SAM protein [Desulfobacteraceae bacterium]
MKILLISANTEQINMPVLPLGMACVGAAVQNAGHEVKILNLMMVRDIRGLLREDISGFTPDVIGISVRNIDDQLMERPNFLLDQVRTVVSECRNFSDAPIVLGGAGYSIFPRRALEYLNADMGIQGEGEKAFVMLLERLEHKGDISEIPGLCLPETGLVKRSRSVKDLDDHPQPLLNAHLLLPPNLENEEIWFPVQTRRGCAMDCIYCSTASIEGRLLRKHSVVSAVNFIRHYANAGIKNFFFVDNTFNFPLPYAKALCDRLIAEGLNIRWRCILYPWKIDDELVEKMAKAGCKEVSLGFESGSESILKRMNKRYTLDDVRRISRLLGKQQIRRMGFLLLGGPGENKDSVKQSFYFADSLETEAMKITSGIRIYPHTALHRYAVDEGIIEPDEDLLFPKFYMAEGLEGWLEEMVAKWMDGRENWIK